MNLLCAVLGCNEMRTKVSVSSAGQSELDEWLGGKWRRVEATITCVRCKKSYETTYETNSPYI